MERNRIMKKRIFSCVVAAAMAIVSFVGCSKEDESRKLSDYSAYVTLGEYKDLDIKVCTGAQCAIAISEIDGNYLSESSNSVAKNKFRYSDTVSIDVL